MRDKEKFFTNAERSLVAKLMLDRTEYHLPNEADDPDCSRHVGEYYRFLTIGVTLFYLLTLTVRVTHDEWGARAFGASRRVVNSKTHYKIR